MENTINLTEKQLAKLNQVQQQKLQLQNQFKELDQKETLIIDLILDMNNIDLNLIESIKIDNNSIIYVEKSL